MKYREADLHYIYIRVEAKNKTLVEMTNNEFADWIISKIDQHKLTNFKFNPDDSLTIAGRVKTINRLDKKGVAIHIVKKEVKHEWDRRLKQKKSP